MTRTIVTLLLCVQLALATPEQFSTPYTTIRGSGRGSNLVWALGSKQTIAWNTTMSDYNITLWQQSTTQNRAKAALKPSFVVTGSPGLNTRDWLVDVLDLDLNDSPVFLLWLDSGSASFTSPFFNITRSTSPSGTPSSSQPSLSGASASSSATATSSPQSTLGALSGSSSNKSDDGLSGTAKAGIGVGIGLGVPLLLLLAAFIWLQSRKSSAIKEADARVEPVPPYHYHEKPYVTEYPLAEVPARSSLYDRYAQPAELDSNGR